MICKRLGFLGIVSWCALGASAFAADPRPVRVVVWDEQQPAQKAAYENFLGNAIADHLAKQKGIVVKSVRLDDAEQGLSNAVLDDCDVLIWWGHVRHKEIKPETAKAIVKRIKDGKLDLIALHSAHWSAPFVEAMAERARLDLVGRLAAEGVRTINLKEIPAAVGTQPKRNDPLTPSAAVTKAGDLTTVIHTLPNCCFPAVRNDGKPSHVRILLPSHPIASGLPGRFDIPQTEMYDEPFHVPKPDEVVFEERWDAGEHFRSGMVWKVGKGKVFYFRPGHETYPIFKQAGPLKLIENAVRWLGAETAPESAG